MTCHYQHLSFQIHLYFPSFLSLTHADDRGGGDRGGEDRHRRAAARSKLVGGDLSYHSSQGMSVLLGHPAQPNAPADQLTSILARKTRSELYEYLSQMQTLLQQNPQQARQVLADNPQLVRGLFQMEIILGMVSNPLGDIAPKGVAPPGILPPRPGEHPLPMDGPPPMHGMPPAYGHPHPNGGPPPQYLPPPQYMAEGPAPMDPRLGGAPAAPIDPRLQAAPMPVPIPMTSAPRPMISAAMGGLPGPGVVPGAIPDQQQALLQQVMSLTPEQIELLPPQQKAQVLALQQQLVSTCMVE